MNTTETPYRTTGTATFPCHRTATFEAVMYSNVPGALSLHTCPVCGKRYEVRTVAITPEQAVVGIIPEVTS